MSSEKPELSSSNPVGEAVRHLSEHFLAHPDAARALSIIIESQVDAADAAKREASARANIGTSTGWGAGSSEGIRRQVAKTEGGADRAHEIANLIRKTLPDLETPTTEPTSPPQD